MQNYLAYFSDLIIATPFSIYLQNLKGMVPVVQTLHLFAIAAALSSAVMIDLRVLGLISRDRPFNAVASRFAPRVWIALVCLAVTGALLITVEPARSLLAAPFQMKMALIALAAVVTAWLQRAAAAQGTAWDGASAAPASVRVIAIGSLVIWGLIILAGRWIAYA